MKTLQLIVFTIVSLFTSLLYAQEEIDSTDIWIQDIEQSLNLQEGKIKLKSANATITTPSGYAFLDATQAKYVLSELWGNPEDESILGLLVKKEYGVLNDKSLAFTVSYDNIGYVEGDDANSIDYHDLLKDLIKETNEANTWRIEQGFPKIYVIGWASNPFYDSKNKVLHWAKQLHFEGEEENTLNYNLRVLGRHGVLFINAVGTMKDLPSIKKDINPIINSIKFDEGSRYKDFDSSTDDIAAWTIGGLVAGKVVAKAGLFTVLAKFGKIIAIAVGGIAIGLWKKIKGRKN